MYQNFSVERTKLELYQLGFKNVAYHEDGLVIHDFQLYLEKSQCHNDDNCFSYPEGIITHYDKINIVKDTHGRIQSITLPIKYIPTSPSNTFKEDLGAMIEYVYCIDASIQVYEENDLLHLPLNGHINAHKVLDYLILRMFKATCVFKPGKNEVSHIGRLMPIIIPYLTVQIRSCLTRSEGDLSLIHRLVDSEIKTTASIQLPYGLIKAYVDKQCREERGLIKIVDKHLQLKERDDFIERGHNFSSNELEKIKQHQISKKPLYIVTTTGDHVFAVTIDFSKSILFVANPLGPCDNFEHILQDIANKCGCKQIKWANTIQLQRSDDIDVNDTCGADAYALIAMMQDVGCLNEGCLNKQPLLTAQFAKAGLVSEMRAISSEELGDGSRQNSEKLGITLTNLKQVLSGYRPTTWIGVILYILTFGYHRSGTIRALDDLCARERTDGVISKNDIIIAISQSKHNDNRKEERIRLFSNAKPIYDGSGTDIVIENIMRHFNK